MVAPKKIVIIVKAISIITTLALGWHILGWVGLIVWGMPIAFMQAISRGCPSTAVYIVFTVGPVLLIGSIFTNLAAGFIVGGIFTPLLTWACTALAWRDAE